MPRRPAIVTQADIKRAVAAVLAAGVKVSGVRVDPGGFTVLTEPVALPPMSEAVDAADVFEARLGGQDGPG